MLPPAADAYLDLPADERFEKRLPAMLKRHAETVAKSKGESRSQYVVAVQAECVTDDMAQTVEWKLTIPEQVQLLKVLSAPPMAMPTLDDAQQRAKDLFGVE